MARLILGIGSNLGDKVLNLQNAINFLKENFIVNNISKVYSTKSLLKDNQDDYFNCVVDFLTDKKLPVILNIIQNIEISMGRVKNTGYWGARLIDIDIIDYDNIIFSSENLNVPHRQMYKRSFVLYPLKDVYKDYIHPILNLSIDEMISLLQDNLNISDTKINIL